MIEAWQDDLGEDEGESVVAKVGLTKAERKKYDKTFNYMLKKVGPYRLFLKVLLSNDCYFRRTVIFRTTVFLIPNGFQDKKINILNLSK